MVLDLAETAVDVGAKAVTCHLTGIISMLVATNATNIDWQEKYAPTIIFLLRGACSAGQLVTFDDTGMRIYNIYDEIMSSALCSAGLVRLQASHRNAMAELQVIPRWSCEFNVYRTLYHNTGSTCMYRYM